VLNPRQTRILATIGPASRRVTVLRRLVKAGMNAVRINCSHGTWREHAAVIRRVRALGEESGKPIAILADLQGPKIRTGPLARGKGVKLAAGAEFVITTRRVGGNATEVGTTYAGLPGDVGKGDRIFLDDGRIELAVEGTDDTDVRCRVLFGGVLGEHKGINLPTSNVSARALTAKDRADLLRVLEAGVDMVALSFVRTADDVRQAQQIMDEVGRVVPVIAKIEKREGFDNLNAILDEVWGVMIARGDLAVETSTAEVPIMQKEIIRRACARAKPVITATQMLESMVSNPRPTRAEASDVANAVLDGTDAVMLSAETAVGRFPVETVRTMAEIAVTAESNRSADTMIAGRDVESGSSPAAACAHGACEVARSIDAAAIVVFTLSGVTARLVAQLRPAVPIVAFTPNVETYRQLSLVWGVTPARITFGASSDRLIGKGARELVKSGYAPPGAAVVMVAGATDLVGAANLIKIHDLPRS